MTGLITAIGIGAALFALMGLTRRSACSGTCAGCTASCGRHQEPGGSHDG